MALPRSKYVQEGKVGVYHCYSRCVRRAFLCGFDTQTGKDFSHRKVWIADRLRLLVSVFAIEISSETNLQGILPITAEEYFDLVDRSGRMIRSDKQSSIDTDLAPILQRIGARPEAWAETVSHFQDKFCLVAGLIGNLQKFADQIGRRWFAGVSAARASFAPSLPL